MDIELTPTLLRGEVTPPPSKSEAHRLIIAASLAKGRSVIRNVYFSKDISATIDAMRALGADIVCDGSDVTIGGITEPPDKAVIDCCESGSTLRFLIPVACALGVETTFIGRGRLPERPITPYTEELPRHGIKFDRTDGMPFTVSGKLTCGEYKIAGNISSQFITGLLLALSITEGKSRVTLTSELESRPYVDITCDCLRKFDCNVSSDGSGFEVGTGGLSPCECTVEADFSQAAFFCAANALGSEIKINGLNVNSFQGDKKIIEICDKMLYNKKMGTDTAFEQDCSDIPDLVPILAVLGSLCSGVTRLTGAARLRIKESDRLFAVSKSLNALGGKVDELADGLVIGGKDLLTGGEVPDFNDHRIPMAMAIASTRCTSTVIIRGADCVGKSYPDFFEVFESLGGKVRKLD